RTPAGQESPPPQPGTPEQVRQSAARKTTIIEPPPDAGDAWEPPPPGSEEAKQDEDVREAAKGEYDMIGNKLPSHLRDIFADEFYDDVIALLKRMAKHVARDPRLYVRLLCNPQDVPFSRALAEFANYAEGVLTAHRPHSLCPVCHSQKSGCKA